MNRNQIRRVTMARYVIRDSNGREIRADDVRRTANGSLEYIEPYTHNVKTVSGGTVRDAQQHEKGIFGGFFQGPKFRW
jgi:hypothetical protein